jgi:phosphoribosylformylglycinamidine synthase
LTDKVPVYIRPTSEPAYFQQAKKADLSAARDYGNWSELLLRLMGSPNLSSRRWVYEQYDHMVGLNTVIRPGGDAALLRLPGSRRGLALTSDCAGRYVYLDPFLGGAIAVAEAALNVAVVGAKPLALTNCLNFGNPENPEIYWQFVNATDGLAEAAKALDTPVTGGNVSFYNEYDGRAIFPTPTIGMIGVIEDLERHLSYDFKKPGDLIVLVGESKEELGASEVHYLLTGRDEGPVPALDLAVAAGLNAFLVEAAARRLLASAHDLSEGGLAVALAECCFPRKLGAKVSLASSISTAALLFGESQSRVALSLSEENLPALETLLLQHQLTYQAIGQVTDDDWLIISHGREQLQARLSELHQAWSEALPNAAAL